MHAILNLCVVIVQHGRFRDKLHHVAWHGSWLRISRAMSVVNEFLVLGSSYEITAEPAAGYVCANISHEWKLGSSGGRE